MSKELFERIENYRRLSFYSDDLDAIDLLTACQQRITELERETCSAEHDTALSEYEVARLEQENARIQAEFEKAKADWTAEQTSHIQHAREVLTLYTGLKARVEEQQSRIDELERVFCKLHLPTHPDRENCGWCVVAKLYEENARLQAQLEVAEGLLEKVMSEIDEADYGEGELKNGSFEMLTDYFRAKEGKEKA